MDFFERFLSSEKLSKLINTILVLVVATGVFVAFYLAFGKPKTKPEKLEQPTPTTVSQQESTSGAKEYLIIQEATQSTSPAEATVSPNF